MMIIYIWICVCVGVFVSVCIILLLVSSCCRVLRMVWFLLWIRVINVLSMIGGCYGFEFFERLYLIKY